MSLDTLQLKPGKQYADESAITRYLELVAKAWVAFDNRELPKLDKLGRWPRTRTNAS